MGQCTPHCFCIIIFNQFLDSTDESEYKDLCCELTIMQQLGDHENVVNLVGACTVGGNLNVILEYCSHGSLLMYLRSKKDDFVKSWDGEDANEVGYSALTRIALQASQGMAFLESKKVKKPFKWKI